MSHPNHKYEFLRFKSALRKRRKSNLKRKSRNIQRNKSKGYKAPRVSKNIYTNRTQNITIYGGKNFTLFENQDSLINVLSSLNDLKKEKRKILIVNIDLSNIVQIDIGAISLLFAKIHEVKQTRTIKIWGTMPKHPGCQEKFKDSGFLDNMKDLNGNKFTKTSRNFFFNIGTDTTLNEVVGKTIKKTIKEITGVEENYQPVYTIAQEMCANSVEWANDVDSRSKNWFMGVNYVLDNGQTSVNFTLTDIGFGILNTLERDYKNKFSDFFETASKIDILYKAFEGKYGSKSGDINRNKGLPQIKKTFESNFIFDLKVYTNNVFLDFKNYENSKVLEKKVPGTFYTWSINKNCIELWKQQMISN